MSSSTRPAEAAAPAPAWTWRARIALVPAYLAVAHLAAVRGSGALAALALFVVALVVLLPALARPRAAAWAATALLGAGLWWLAATPHAGLALRLVPPACVLLVASGFARTLRRGRVPLVTRIVAALDGCAPAALAPELQAYARGLTLAWTLLLAALGAFDLAMALFATPEQWSWFANIGDYVVIGAFMLLEFAWRKHRFPGRHRSFVGFLRRMLALGPAFWRGVAAP